MDSHSLPGRPLSRLFQHLFREIHAESPESALSEWNEQSPRAAAEIEKSSRSCEMLLHKPSIDIEEGIPGQAGVIVRGDARVVEIVPQAPVHARRQLPVWG